MIAIIGYSGHGKDTLAKTIQKIYGLSWTSVSHFAVKSFIFTELKHKYNYLSEKECYDDRINHREEFYNLIRGYNNNDKSRIIKEISLQYDMVVGIRDMYELYDGIAQGVITRTIGVYCPQKLIDPFSEMSIDVFRDSDMVIGNPKGINHLDRLEGKVRRNSFLFGTRKSDKTHC